MDQVFTLIWLKFKIMTHKLRHSTGIANLVVQVIFLISNAIMSLVIAVVFGGLIYLTGRTAGAPNLLTVSYIMFYTFFFFSVVIPCLSVGGNLAFEPAQFLVYPLSRLKLYLISLAANIFNLEHMLYYPALLTVAIIEIVVFRTDLLLALMIPFCIALFYIVWNNTLILMLQSIMKRRRSKELIVIISMAILVVVSMLPVLQDSSKTGMHAGKIPFSNTISFMAVKIAKNFPPSLAAEGFHALHESDYVYAFQVILWLTLWIAGGIVLGYQILVRYHLGEKGKIKKHKQPLKNIEITSAASSSYSMDRIIFSFFPDEIGAMIFKDLHYLFRSVVGKFNLIMLPVFVMIFSIATSRHAHNPFFGIDSKNLVLFGMLLYISLFSNNFIYNLYGWENNGVNFYFLSPVHLEKVIFGKNIALGFYNAILFLGCIIIWMIFVAIPGLFTIITGLLLFCMSVVMSTIAGDIVSITFPVHRDISSIKNSPSQTASLASFLVLIINTVLSAGVLLIPAYLNKHYLQPVLLAFILSIQLIVYYFVILNFSARLMEKHKEKLIDALHF